MPSKHRKIVADFDAMDRFLVELFLDSRPGPPEIVLDLDSTDIPLHGEQEERFFHGYFREYCYMPLLVFCGRTPLLARLRSAAEYGAAGMEKDPARRVERIRERRPHTQTVMPSAFVQAPPATKIRQFSRQIILRTDTGFCREPILAWCESAGVDSGIGLARNRRLQERIAAAMHGSRAATTGRPSRWFRSFWWRTRKSWSRRRRVIAKAEVLPGSDGRRGKDNPRFLVPPCRHPPTRPGDLRGVPLRQGRRGKPRKRATVAPLLQALRKQPVRRQRPPLPVLDLRLPACGAAAQGLEGNQTRTRQRRYPAAAPAAHRRPGPQVRSPHPYRPVRCVPRSTPVPARLGRPRSACTDLIHLGCVKPFPARAPACLPHPTPFLPRGRICTQTGTPRT